MPVKFQRHDSTPASFQKGLQEYEPPSILRVRFVIGGYLSLPSALHNWGLGDASEGTNVGVSQRSCQLSTTARANALTKFETGEFL